MAEDSAQGVFLCTLIVCTPGVWVPKPWNMALKKSIWDPKLRVANSTGTDLKSLDSARNAFLAYGVETPETVLAISTPKGLGLRAYKSHTTVICFSLPSAKPPLTFSGRLTLRNHLEVQCWQQSSHYMSTSLRRTQQKVHFVEALSKGLKRRSNE